MVKLGKNEIIHMQIKRIEKEIRDTPYHKGTEHHIGRLRARLSKLRDELENKQAISKGSGGGGYSVKKQGDATVVLVGHPSAGKSTLLNNLTNANSKIAPYAFTTVTVVPGMMVHKEARIQILDVPGLIEEAEKGKGRGREVLSVARGADLLLIMCDVENVNKFSSITKTLEGAGVRVNKVRPEVLIEKKTKGGLRIISNIKQNVGKDTVESIAKEFGLGNAEITFKQKVSLDELIDVFSRNRVYIPALYVINKIDLSDNDLVLPDIELPDAEFIKISAEENYALDTLKDKIWKNLDFVRVYLVRMDQEPSMNNPIITKAKNTLYDVAESIGSEFAEGKERAKIWGPGAKFPGQLVSLTTKVQEGMQVRFV